MNMSVGMKVLQTLKDILENGCDRGFVQDAIFSIHGLHSKLEYVKQTATVQLTKIVRDLFLY